jgi:hypothetical protein
MSNKQSLSPKEISEIVRGLEPVDWVQVELLAKMPPSKRIIPALHAQEFSMAGLRGTFRRRFPELSLSEINMKVLAYLTPVRMEFK